MALQNAQGSCLAIYCTGHPAMGASYGDLGICGLKAEVAEFSYKQSEIEYVRLWVTQPLCAANPQFCEEPWPRGHAVCQQHLARPCGFLLICMYF